MKKPLASLFTLICVTTAAWAGPIEFDFKDPKGVNNAVFKLDAPLESINGTANGVSGKIVFDPEKPGQLKGKIIVATASMHVGNPTMKEHLHSDGWMDSAKHPELTFEIKNSRNVKTSGDVTTADVDGTLTIKGISKDVTVPVRLTYLKDKLRARGGNKDGDLLVVRSNFVVHRSDFNIKPGQNEDKVSNEIDLSLSIAGIAPR
jgi:polyisoprenoid-binding protein YceI